jgi:hypothetical protein
MKPKSTGAWVLASIEDLRRELVRCEDQSTVHISRECICDRFAFRGVPARAVDVLIDQRILNHVDDDLPLVLSRSLKAGKYDHAVRDRWLVRRMRAHSAAQQNIPDAECLLSNSRDKLVIRVLIDGRVVSPADYDRLPPIDASYDQTACVKRNWTRYFRHLDWETDVAPRLDAYESLAIDPDRTTLSELNMHASRWLADVSYQLGWSRVIAKAAERRGLGLWHRDEPEAPRDDAELEAIEQSLTI